MPEIGALFLATHTHDITYGSSPNDLRAYWTVNDYFDFEASPPARGKMSMIHKVLTAAESPDYDQFAGTNLSLTVDGSNQWAPRAAFIYCGWDTGSRFYFRPLAMNFNDMPTTDFVGQGATQQYLPLVGILPPDPGFNQIHTFVLALETSSSSYSGSPGPLEFSIYGRDAGSSNSAPYLLFQTTLTKMGKQAAGEKGGYYFISFDLSIPIDISNTVVPVCTVRNKGDNGWQVGTCWLFGIGINGWNTYRHVITLGSIGMKTVSQDPHDFDDFQASKQVLTMTPFS